MYSSRHCPLSNQLYTKKGCATSIHLSVVADVHMTTQNSMPQIEYKRMIGTFSVKRGLAL